MTPEELAETQRGRGRLAGLVYPMIIVFATPSQLIVRSALVVDGDAAATAANILASESLFRVAFATDLIAHLFDLVLVMLFYRLFEAVLISMVFFGCGVAVLGRLFWCSGYVPRALAAAYGLGAGLLVVGILALFLAPELARPLVPVFLAPDALAEWSMCLWLLVRGVRVGPAATA